MIFTKITSHFFPCYIVNRDHTTHYKIPMRLLSEKIHTTLYYAETHIKDNMDWNGLSNYLQQNTLPLLNSMMNITHNMGKECSIRVDITVQDGNTYFTKYTFSNILFIGYLF